MILQVFGEVQRRFDINMGFAFHNLNLSFLSWKFQATLPESIRIYNSFSTIFPPKVVRIEECLTCACSGNAAGKSNISHPESRSQLFSRGPARKKVFRSSATLLVDTYDLALLMIRKSLTAPLPLKREGKPRTRSNEATSLGIARATLTMNSLFITRKGALLTLRAKRSR